MSPQAPALPSVVELADLVDQVAGDWAYLAARPAGRPAPGPADLPVEFSVRLQGPCQYLFVVRGGWDLAGEVAEASTGDPAAREQSADAFRELVNLLAGHLITRHLASPQGSFGAFLPMASRPQDWPSAEPGACAAVMVEHYPLELRLWALEPPHA